MKSFRMNQGRRIALLVICLSILLPSYRYFKNSRVFHDSPDIRAVPQAVPESIPASIPLSGQVLRVVDGDTIQLSNGEWVRYIGIDAPELRRKIGTRWIEDPQPGAAEAYELNRKLVEGKQVRLELDIEQRDRFHRLLAYVFVGGLFVNAELVKSGYAKVLVYPPNTRYHELLGDLEEKAKSEKRGLWTRRAKQAGQLVAFLAG